jgi:hypothetical protein
VPGYGILTTPLRRLRDKVMASSITFQDFKVDIEVRNIDGIFQNIFDLSFPKGFWVLLTIQSNSGNKETFPRVDSDYRVITYQTYEEAIDDIASFLKSHFNS